MLKTLPSGHFHVAITSPPYWALRDYKVPGQLGLEESPSAYVEKMVAVFEEVKRVLRDDGVLWVNISDTYGASGRGGGGGSIQDRDLDTKISGRNGHRAAPAGMKPLDLCGIPWQLALAMRDAGWYLRSDCIWVKAAPMPESVQSWRWERCRVKTKDRPVRHSKTAWEDDGDKPAAYSEDWKSFAQAEWSPCPGCKKCEANGGLVLRRGSWRPTRAHEYVFQFCKGSSRVSRVIKFLDLPDQIFHLGQYLRLGSTKPLLFDSSDPHDLDWLGQICVSLAATIFDFSQIQNEQSLPPFYSQEWKQLPNGRDSDFVSNLPLKYRPSVWACRFMSSDLSSKVFLKEIQRLGVTLAGSNHFLIGSGLLECPLPPGARFDGNATIAINHAGKVRKIDFAHSCILEESQSSASYYGDAEPVKTTPAEATKIRDKYSRVIDDGGEYAVQHDHETICAGANLRSWWMLPPEAFKGEHYAAFPSSLPAKAILSSTSAHGCCAGCGAPWARVIEEIKPPSRRVNSNGPCGEHGFLGENRRDDAIETKTIGWKPTCTCNRETVPCRVLDPFVGSGTTLLVCLRTGRDGTGIELSPRYAEMARKRLKDESPLFAGA